MAVCFLRDFTFSQPTTQHWTKHDCLLYRSVRHPLEWCCNEVQNLLPSVWTPGFCNNITVAAYMLYVTRLTIISTLNCSQLPWFIQTQLVFNRQTDSKHTFHVTFYTYYIKVAIRALSDIRAVQIKMWLQGVNFRTGVSILNYFEES